MFAVPTSRECHPQEARRSFVYLYSSIVSGFRHCARSLLPTQNAQMYGNLCSICFVMSFHNQVFVAVVVRGSELSSSNHLVDDKESKMNLLHAAVRSQFRKLCKLRLANWRKHAIPVFSSLKFQHPHVKNKLLHEYTGTDMLPHFCN